MPVWIKPLFCAVAIMMILSCLEGAHADMTTSTVDLPHTVGSWSRSESAQIIDADNIFAYMNGAGELYLAYRFDHLEVYEYTADDQDDILVEVYVMQTSDDAFGLLSLDWGGEPMTFSDQPSPSGSTPAPSVRALYGSGLLRLWADTIYARILAYRETPEARDAVLALGRAIAADRDTPPAPEFLKVLPQAIGSAWQLRADRIGYFRSHLVLNSLYYLSHQNILNLDHSVEAVTAPYEYVTDPSIRPQVLVVNYAGPEHTQHALEQFHAAYLPDNPKTFDVEGTAPYSEVFALEDGWLGYSVEGRCLTMVFECPDQEAASLIIEQISCPAIKKEE
ncbi:hypothetical protein GF339_04930 [candidate division KSB3 bacterium]|uniref:Uncharacterized protein n=1 Tax=candidate division KSB3 bacterium TaxID=2044937 RepID=A0A9D5JTP7_9BACT|nr:hypothetical protein [candidate division KSB3 bacterium]MBD3323905.1 hypothetical protein [candidate division KSB3 bacterium]